MTITRKLSHLEMFFIIIIIITVLLLYQWSTKYSWFCSCPLEVFRQAEQLEN